MGTERALASTWTEVALIALVLVLTVTLRGEHYMTASSSWDTPVIDGQRHRSLAGWWRMCVSHPLFLLLLLRSVVRLLAWVRVLWGIARLRLRLIPAHADLVGGLRFVTTSVFGFLPLAFTFSAIMAARVAQGVINDGLPLLHFRAHIIITFMTAVVMFAGPMLLFQRQLWNLKVRGTFQYGELATRVGRRFEARWLSRGPEMTAEVLEKPDFSATTDLFGIVANVRQSQMFLLDTTIIIPLVVTVMLPFIPVILALVPVDDILAVIGRAVL